MKFRFNQKTLLYIIFFLGIGIIFIRGGFVKADNFDYITKETLTPELETEYLAPVANMEFNGVYADCRNFQRLTAAKDYYDRNPNLKMQHVGVIMREVYNYDNLCYHDHSIKGDTEVSKESNYDKQQKEKIYKILD